jgi:hypothetical protein
MNIIINMKAEDNDYEESNNNDYEESNNKRHKKKNNKQKKKNHIDDENDEKSNNKPNWGEIIVYALVSGVIIGVIRNLL